MKCSVCGKEFSFGHTEDGLPNGMTFVTSSGNVTMCADCIIEVGRRKEREDLIKQEGE